MYDGGFVKAGGDFVSHCVRASVRYKLCKLVMGRHGMTLMRSVLCVLPTLHTVVVHNCHSHRRVASGGDTVIAAEEHVQLFSNTLNRNILYVVKK